ncbi:MAG TPA: hypothetical protein VFH66_12445 [Mycobacteriales bacterium]|nr:hypothetical protein [Mycobacteriales bacterium]
MKLLAAGAHLSLRPRDGEPVTVRCDSVAQRAWSRTAAAHGPDGERWFLKQFVTRSGHPRGDLFEAERVGAETGRAVFRRLRVLTPVAVAKDDLLLAYPWHDLTPFDELLRADPQGFAASYPAALRAAAHDLLGSRDAELLAGLPEKRADTAVLGVGVVFKGLEIRNLAVCPGSDQPVAFDLGRARRGPLEEAGARLFVSAALLDWGRPVTRFARGPQEALMALAWEHLQAVVTKESCLRELDHQYRTRLRDDGWTYGRARHARRAVVRAVGGRYARQVRQFVTSR